MTQRLKAAIRVSMKEHDFLTMIRRLESQAENRREAGAFLLASTGDRHSGAARMVMSVEYYCDLDPDSLTGGITFHASGYTGLNRICRERNLRVVADIHLHPGPGTRQSSTDAAHPMVARTGHLALIAPNFGAGVYKARQLGAHIKTSDGWQSYSGREINDVFRVHTTLQGRLMRIGDSLMPQRGRTSRG